MCKRGLRPFNKIIYQVSGTFYHSLHSKTSTVFAQNFYITLMYILLPLIRTLKFRIETREVFNDDGITFDTSYVLTTY